MRKKQDGWDSGFGLYLPVEGLGLRLQAPKLPLDEISQSLPHFQLKGQIKIELNVLLHMQKHINESSNQS